MNQASFLILAMALGALNQPLRAQTAGAASPSGALQLIKGRGRLIVGNEFVFPGFNAVDPSTNRNEGFFADIARDLAGRILGDENKVEFVKTTDDTRLQWAAEGKVDVLIDTIPRGSEKAKLVDFSEDTFISGSGLLVRKGSPIHTIADIRAGTRVIYGKENLDVKLIQAKVPDAVYIEFPKSAEAFQALKDGKGDVFTQVVTHLYRAARQDPNFVLTGRFTTKHYAMAYKKGDKELGDLLNEFLRSIRASGEYDRLYSKWFSAYGGDDPTVR
jgi:aspartate/glutamate/glutamine transport system substrate-binding protein